MDNYFRGLLAPSRSRECLSESESIHLMENLSVVSQNMMHEQGDYLGLKVISSTAKRSCVSPLDLG